MQSSCLIFGKKNYLDDFFTCVYGQHKYSLGNHLHVIVKQLGETEIDRLLGRGAFSVNHYQLEEVIVNQF